MITKHFLLELSHVKHIENDDVVLVQEMKPRLFQLDRASFDKPGNLYIIEEVIQYLQSDLFFV